jgi:hypothetical protein
MATLDSQLRPGIDKYPLIIMPIEIHRVLVDHVVLPRSVCLGSITTTRAIKQTKKSSERRKHGRKNEKTKQKNKF